jgi:hypothetical protein
VRIQTIVHDGISCAGYLAASVTKAIFITPARCATARISATFS